MRLAAVLELDNYAAAVARNPYLHDREQRLLEGHYSALAPPPKASRWRRRLLGGLLRRYFSRTVDGVAFPRTAEDGGGDVGGRPDAASRAEEVRVQAFLHGLSPPRRLTYGTEMPDVQFVDVYLPNDSERLLATADGLPAVLIVHGGFFKDKWSSRNTQTTSLVPFLLERGFAVGLVEYRRRGMAGGTYPGPEDDVVAGLRALAAATDVDVSRLIVLGHSAGATLAVAACERLRSESASFAAVPSAALCVSIAPVPDMITGYEARLSDEGDAIERYLGTEPTSEEDRKLYRRASLPETLATPSLLVSGTMDADVPSELVRDYYAKCAAPEVQLLELPCAGHYDVVTADAKPWLRVWQRASAMLHATRSKLAP